jgi:curli production assembly/transport component CsgG
MMNRYFHRGRGIFAIACIAVALNGCAVTHPPAEVAQEATPTPASPSTRELKRLPPPKMRIYTAVYGFRDQTGQYKQAPDSSFSTSVTQGAISMVVKALQDSGWFIPVEREGLQNLLTERKIVRAVGEQQPKDAPPIVVPALVPASILVEGGVIAYESNVRSGGVGARFLGVGLSTLYRMDQVTVALRSIDTRTGQVLQNVSTTKTIFSYEIRPSIFKFVNFKDLVEVEAGITRNEPAQLCVKEAIESAVLSLTVQGIKDRAWALKNDADWNHPVIQKYASDELAQVVNLPAEGQGAKP